MNIPPVLKNKWVWIGGGAVILIALVASGSSRASTSQAVAVGPSDAEVAASRDITLATLQAQASASGASAQLALATRQGDIELAKATMDNALSRYAIDAQASMQALQIEGTKALQLAEIGSQERRDAASIASQLQLSKWTLDQATANAEIQTNFQLQYAEAANATNISIAQMQANLVSNQLIVSRDVTLAGLATQTELAGINANLQRDVTYSNNATQQAVYASMVGADVEKQRIDAEKDVQLAKYQYKGKKSGDLFGVIGKGLGILGGIFSDPRVKTNVTRIGTMPETGLPLYHYNVPWAEATQHGVMADEVAALAPWALGPVIEGVATVDYSQVR